MKANERKESRKARGKIDAIDGMEVVDQTTPQTCLTCFIPTMLPAAMLAVVVP